MRIIVDAMGGDNAPREIIKGCAMAIGEYGVEVTLCGRGKDMHDVFASEGLSEDGFSFIETDVVVDMHDASECVVREKRASSMGTGLDMLARGEGDAFISAGSTGALLVGATLIVKRIRGVFRAAIATVIPNASGSMLLIDTGANVDCKPEYLNQFAVMGTIYRQSMFGEPSPRVGLLNNGTEETKGTQLHIDANALLAQNSEINFIGNIEGRDGPMGAADVVVADGFTGNVFLKTMEGMGKSIFSGLKDVINGSLRAKIGALLMKKSLYAMKARFDYSEYGGAPLLGINGVVIKAHGSSDAVAFKNAIRQAIGFSDSGLNQRLTAALGKKN